MPADKVEIGDPFTILGILATGYFEIGVPSNFQVNIIILPTHIAQKTAGIANPIFGTSKPLSCRMCNATIFVGWRTKLCLEKPPLN